MRRVLNILNHDLLRPISYFFMFAVVCFLLQFYYVFRMYDAGGLDFWWCVSEFGTEITKTVLYLLFFAIPAYFRLPWSSYILPFSLPEIISTSIGTFKTGWTSTGPIAEIGKIAAVVDIFMVPLIVLNTLFLVLRLTKWINQKTKMDTSDLPDQRK